MAEDITTPIDTIMDTIYDWVDSIINNSNLVDPPYIEIIPSHKDLPAPSGGAFITIDYTPASASLGKADWETTEEEGIIYKTLRQDWEGTVEIWETNGTGAYLYKLINHQWMPEANEILRANYISFKRNNDVVSIPETVGEKWKRQSVVEIVFGFGMGIKYVTDDIIDVAIDGTLDKDGGGEIDVAIDKDSPAPS